MPYGARSNEQRRHGEQRVEPAARLVQRLADEVRREARARSGRSFSNGKWCWANGIAPESNHTSMTSGTRCIALRALRAREADLVDERAVRVLEPHAAELLELVEGADDVRRGPPRSATPAAACPSSARARAPSRRCWQPVAEAPVLDVLGVPVDRLVGGEQLVAQLRRRDVPRRLGVVEQRGAAAPAVRVGVLVLLGAQQPAARAQVLDQVGVGVLDEAPGVAGRCARRTCRRGCTGLTTFSPYCAPRRKSSSPNAIAVCTMPVPSSAVTKSPSSTVCPRSPYSRPVMNGTAARSARRPAPRRGSGRGSARPRRAPRSTRASASTTGASSAPASRARTCSSGSTATAALETSVHGVVVQTSSSSPACSGPPSSATRKRT